MKNIVIALSLLVAHASAISADTVNPPNFILILTDDQSYVGTSFPANPEDERTKSNYYQTPNMERLATMGMRFSNGYSPAPFCCPTRRSICVGQTPARHEYQADRENWTRNYRNQLSIPRMLKDANPRYKTAHFGKWDHRYDRVTPAEMGYDFSDGDTGNDTGGGKGSEWPKALDDPKLIFSLTERSCKFMEDQVSQGNPFYLQVSHYAVHLGITYTQKSLDKYSKLEPNQQHFIPEFAAMTEDLDTGIGILLDKVQELGILDNTYIIFMSDNGGRTAQPIGGEQVVARNFPLRDGKGSMYEGGIRVPFVFIGPDVAENTYSHVPVTGLDILPTLAELSGYSKQLPADKDGGSIMEVARNKGAGVVKRQRPYLVFHQAVDRSGESAIRRENYKLVKQWKNNQLELFDLSRDISEEDDLSGKLPEITRQLDTELSSFLMEVGAETRQIKD